MESDTEGPFGIIHPRPTSTSGLVSPHPLSLAIRLQRIWSFVLERDEAHRLHSSSIREVVQLKDRMEYLQAALQVVEEEVTEAWALATTARVRAYGEFLLSQVPIH